VKFTWKYFGPGRELVMEFTFKEFGPTITAK